MTKKKDEPIVGSYPVETREFKVRKRLYREPVYQKGKLKVNKSEPGEWIEQKIARMLNNGEPISEGAPLNYTERKDGVLAETNIRHDKWDSAVEAMDTLAGRKREFREKRGMVVEMKPKEDGKSESTQATDGQEPQK